jgi:hypothetical protein
MRASWQMELKLRLLERRRRAWPTDYRPRAL